MKKRFLLALIGLLAFSLTACGEKGETGPQGEQGIPGQNGTNGKDGTSVLTGHGEPLPSLGNNGDSYIDLDNWNYYVKENGSWVLKGNIKGSDGADGNDGQDGQDGNDGTNGVDGQDGTSVRTGNGTPTDNLGKDGDFYIDLLTWNYYVKENGSWVLKGNIKGADGGQGSDAVQYIPAIFNNYDGSMLYTFYYEKGSDIVYDGPEPTREGYKEDSKYYGYNFTGWDKPLENIQVPTIFTAQYEKVDVTDIVLGKIPHFSKDGKTLTYGLYPQKNIDDADLLTILNGIATPESNGYYLYAGDYYAKTNATPNSSSYTFDNDTTIVNGTTYWFKCEPISWNVLSDANGDYYIASSVILDAYNYYSSTSQRTISTQTVYANNYKYSDIRAWLNGYDGSGYSAADCSSTSFYKSAFTLNDLYIEDTEVDNSASTSYGDVDDYVCDNTTDKVFLPSFMDYVELFSPDTKCCKTTDWARARGAWYDKDYDYNGRYWSRSPYSSSNIVWAVDMDGYFVSEGEDAPLIYQAFIGVRPAITIKII